MLNLYRTNYSTKQHTEETACDKASSVDTEGLLFYDRS